MSKLSRHLVLALLWTISAVGCQSMSDRMLDEVLEPVGELDKSLDREIRLAQWRKRPDVEVTSTTQYRWELVASETPGEPELAATDTVDAPVLKHDTTAPDEFEKRLRSEIRETPANSVGPPALSWVSLSQRDDLVGWQFAILWGREGRGAWQSEDSNATAYVALAASIEPRLRELVLDPPRFDRNGGKRSGILQAAEVNLSSASISPLLKRSKTKDPLPNATPSSTDEITVEMRAAAAEAWCRVLATSDKDPIDALAPAGRALERDDLPIEVRCELFRSIARWIPPTDIPGLAEALDTGSGKQIPTELRRAAFDACLIYAAAKRKAEFDPTEWPPGIMSCQYDAEPQTRMAFGRWIAAARHPQACETLKALMLDTNLSVREDALVSLGRLGTDAARQELQRQAQRTEPRIRASAVRGLAQFGPSAVAKFVADGEPEVRAAIAEQIANTPSAESALLLRRLVGDSSPLVQEKCVAAVAEWPDELATPLLLAGIRDASRPVRQRCAIALRERTGILDVIPVEGSNEERSRFVNELARTHGLETELVDQARTEAFAARPVADAPRSVDVRAWLDALATQPADSPEVITAIEQLRQLTPADLSAVEEFLFARPDDQPIALIENEILPRLSPVYRALQQLKNSDVAVRRDGARAIAVAGENASLSALAVRRLRTALVHEQDQVVWRHAINGIGRDATDAAAEVALLALNHAWPDIRLLGCEYVAKHARPQHAAWLVPLFSDRNKEVRLAAARAAGSCRGASVVDDLPQADGETPMRGLRSLLTDADARIRQAAAVSMCRLGDADAAEELKRLSLHEDATLREQVIREMGTTGQTRFIEHLVHCGWTERDDRVKRAIAESLEMLTPRENHPAGLGDQADVDAKIRLWATWWDGRRTAAATDSPPSPATQPPL